MTYSNIKTLRFLYVFMCLPMHVGFVFTNISITTQSPQTEILGSIPDLDVVIVV